MNLNKPQSSLTPDEHKKLVTHLAQAKRYGSPRRVWVEDGHVFIEGYDGDVIWMTPEVAIAMGRMLSEAGTDALINRVMDDGQNISK